MKNFKKVVSLVLALAMVLSLATSAFGAATTSDEKAKVLYDLDLFAGKSTTAYVPDLAGPTDRQQAMVMLSRAFAWNPVAGTLSGFPDVETWAEAEVAEAVDREITNGVGDGTTFGGANTISEREMATWIDRALGAELAGSWEANADLDSTTPLTRGDLVDMIWDALMETPVGGSETLIETIVGTNNAKIEIAVDGGLIEQARLVPEILFDEDALVDGVLRADGASSVLVTFQLTDSITGLPAVTDRDYEVAFSATFGTFGEQRVTSENGVATVLLTSEFLTEDVVSVLNATIIESEREEDEIIGIETSVNLIMSPNPEALSDDSVGASMTDAESNEADRIILYFNKQVDVDAFIWSADEAVAAGFTTAEAGMIDPAACTIEVWKDSTDGVAGTQVDVLTLAPLKDYDGNDIPNAVQVILDVDDDAGIDDSITDNSDVWVSFTDKTKALDVPSTRTFKDTDVRKPSMLSVVVVDLNTIQVNFSEAVLDIDPNVVQASAEILNNWQINGTLISDPMWNATATVGTFARTTGTDSRHVVTIDLGNDIFGDQIYFTPGTYSVQAANIGDWARLTDDKNVMNTQTLDFVIPEDNTVPVPTITVMSPEQYLVEWNCFIAETAAQLSADMKVQKYNTTTAAWDDVDGESTMHTIAGGTTEWTDGDMDFDIIQISNSATGSRFIVEADLDWTVYYNTSVNHKNYFNDLYRVFFAASAAKNIANGKVSAETALQLTDAMYSPDTTSPTIVSIVENATTSTDYDVTFTEPVKESSLLAAGIGNDGDDAGTPDQEHGGTDVGGAGTDATDWALLPEPTYEFISDDYGFSVPGVAQSIDELHQIVTVRPATALKTLYVGGWTLVVRSISDDVGNTLPTDTEDFVVAGDTTTAVAFDIEWAFADIDHDLVIEDVDGAPVDTAEYDEDAYDFVFIKFTKALATSGDFKNALKTSNYTIDGQNLPTGTSIVANIKNYDDYDSIVDSVTIRLPEGYLEGVNSPHNINISKYIESADGDVLGSKGGEKTLEYVVTDFSGNLANDTFVLEMAAEVDIMDEMIALRAAYVAAIVTPTQALLDAYEAAYVAAEVLVDALEDANSVRGQWQDYLASTWLALHNAIVAGDYFLVADADNDDDIDTVFGSNAVEAEVDAAEAGVADYAGGDEYSFTSTLADTTEEVTAIAAGVVTLAGGATDDGGTDTVTVTITDLFWLVSATINVEAIDDAEDDMVDPATSTTSVSTTNPTTY